MNSNFWCMIANIALLLILLTLLLSLNRKLKEMDPIKESGRIVYEDLTRQPHSGRTLYSESYGLSGKPDLIIKRGTNIIPVEIKNMRAPQEAYEGHIAQLIAYCLLIEECYGKKPKYGLLQYRDKSYEIAYTMERRKWLLSTMKEMRKVNWQTDLHRMHKFEKRCVYCGFRDACSENLCPDNEK